MSNGLKFGAIRVAVKVATDARAGPVGIDLGAAASQAHADLASAYAAAAGAASNRTLTGQDLGGLTLTPGVYTFASSAQLTGTLTLDAQGDSGAVFVFQIGSTLVTADQSAVAFTNGGSGTQAFLQVGSAATLGAGTA